MICDIQHPNFHNRYENPGTSVSWEGAAKQRSSQVKSSALGDQVNQLLFQSDQGKKNVKAVNIFAKG